MPDTPQWPTEPCRSCGKPVIWCQTGNARSMPVDAQPSADGNILLRPGVAGKPLAQVLTPAEQFGRQGKLRTSHFASCRDANRWRRPRRKAA